MNIVMLLQLCLQEQFLMCVTDEVGLGIIAALEGVALIGVVT